MLWHYTSYCAFAVAIYAFFSAWKQKRDIYAAAAVIAQKADTSIGGSTQVLDDGSIAIKLDNQVVEVIPSGNLKTAEDILKIESKLEQIEIN